MSALMVQGTSSWAGKSLITTALARAFHRRGIDVVPFKAQNMSNNARVVVGGEIGAAQYLQALAAGVVPDVQMNPVLVKPEGDNKSQVVVLGKVDRELSRLPWRQRAKFLWPTIERSLKTLLVEHDVVFIEGAGSPAEINLRDTDLANMSVAAEADASAIIVVDINRGGAFAHLYGTWALLPEDERERIVGFVLNKFRGDASLLTPGPERLEALTGVPTVGVVPWLDHGLPDEDGAASPARHGTRMSIAVIRYPTASNLDEFKLLEQVADVSWTASGSDVELADLVVLPGSKHVAADLEWLNAIGLSDTVKARVGQGCPVLGICGGMQMLGRRIEDAAGVDGSADGLGLLPITTRFDATKQTSTTSTRFTTLPRPWSGLSCRQARGYQIRHGHSHANSGATEALPDGLGYVEGPVLGVYLHGLFEQPDLVASFVGSAPLRSLDQVFDDLADAVEKHVDVGHLLRAVGYV